MEDLPNTSNTAELLTFFFLLLAISIVSTSYFIHSTGQSDMAGGAERYSQYKGDSRTTNEQLSTGFVDGDGHSSNDSIIRLDNESFLRNAAFFSFWNDPNFSCTTKFKCVANFTTGWNDNSSIQISTIDSENNRWSSIYGKEAIVKSNERYELVTHLKHNLWSTQSHVKLEGYNDTSKNWFEIDKCPSATNESLEWNEYKCIITIEPDVTKVRAVLNAGWSSQSGRQATSWFDSISMIKFKPNLIDPKLKAEIVYQGLDQPVSMQFLGPNDFLVIENKGTVQRITNGKQVSQPLLFLNVSYNQGLLGIAVKRNFEMNQTGTDSNKTYVFLYYTANEKGDNLKQGKEGVSNRLYRYELIDNKLVNPSKLLELPAEYDHNGGPLLIGPDKNSVYLSVGDLENESYEVITHKALNDKDGAPPNGSGGILRITLDGKVVHDGLLGKLYPLNLYYGYGIRESFGMDFDPITGKLWDTENGANWGDEINLVEPGFNGGWNKVQGIWNRIGDGYPNGTGFPDNRNITYNPTELVDFAGKGKYRSPEFTWFHTVGPTALTFLSTDKLGKQYENDMIVGDVNNGRIYHFKLNSNRTALELNGPLIDKVANSDKELDNLIFAKGFGIITDLKIGFDGSLYVVVFSEGKIYRISPL